jgi:WD40 repeat protein
MNWRGIRLSFALVVIAVVVASVTASPAAARPRWSDWSTPVPVTELNTAGLLGDGTPAETKDGLTLYFASFRIGGLGGIDMWVAQRASTDAAWGTPTNLGPAINSTADDFGPALSRDGHGLFWNSNRPGGAGLTDLYTSYRTHTRDDFGDNGWQAASPVVSVNTAFGEANPSYFQDDETGRSYLFFNSNRPGGLGLNDIWMAEQQPDGSFGPASNVAALNSSFGEGRPTLSHDGLEIIFMSTRTGGGVQHLWSATRESTSAEWSTPVFLTSVNSTIHDGFPHLSPDGERLYIVRSPTGTGPFSIYLSTRTKETGKP